MTSHLFFNLAALAAFLPATLVSLRRDRGRDAFFRAALAFAVAGPLAWTAVQLADSWHTGLSSALWVSISASLLLFAVLATWGRHAWRLTPLLLPYLFLLGLIATIWQRAEGKVMAKGGPVAWVEFHIVVSVATYGLLTLAAMAALAAFLQERALKSKRPNRLTRVLPPVTVGEELSGVLLIASEVVLGLGLLSGMALQYTESGILIHPDHKTVFSVLAFLVIGALLAAHRMIGVRGKAAARLVLLAYLLLTLAYPGVKFVTDVLLR
ncbi:MAG: cytochrome c biogenesis protein CcsA [Alphaproteobacteria bacterium]|nr:cytochrome c biogenesis protein CcsA [Alphaproteobacteria bacterium]MBF0129699.1 cytochrome c biogenesis protein CcsA [Alphaproteobacteria bacterium]